MFHSFKNLFRSATNNVNRRRVYNSKRLRLEMLLDRIVPDVTPIGSEFQVNSNVEGSQDSPAIARDFDGNFVIVWVSGNQGSIVAQRFDTNGTPQGSEFQVDSHQDGGAIRPAVSMSNVSGANGQFVVVWEDLSDFNHRIYSRRFETDGTPIDGEDVQVNRDDEFFVTDPAVAMDPVGSFAVTWTGDSEIRGRHFDAAWDMYGDEFRVNSETIGNDRLHSSVAINQGGNFVAVWHTQIGPGGVGKRDINGRLFNSSGQPVSADFPVNADISPPVPTPLIDDNPSVAMNGEGFFVVAWDSHSGGPLSPPPDGDRLAILSRRFDPSGLPLDASDVVVNTHAEGNQYLPTVAMSPEGQFVITWNSGDNEATQDGELAGVFGQAYFFDGSQNGGEFLVNTTIAGDQLWPAVAMNGTGNFVIAWMSEDKDGNGIFAQMFAF